MDKPKKPKEADVKRLTTKATKAAAGKFDITPASAEAADEANEAYWRQLKLNRSRGGSEPRHPGLQDLVNSIVAAYIKRDGIPPTHGVLLGTLEKMRTPVPREFAGDHEKRLDAVQIDGDRIWFTTRSGKDESIAKKTLYDYLKRALPNDSG